MSYEKKVYYGRIEEIGDLGSIGDFVMSHEKKLNSIYEDFKKIATERIPNFTPKIAVILGSGLGGLADEVEPFGIINYNELDGFPVSTAPEHKGCFVFANIDDVPVVFMQGRVHYYEGYSSQDVVLPIRLMKLMGAETLLITNASGSLNKDFKIGDFMVISDQISNFVPSPLIGSNIETLGVRFPDMSEIYKKELRHKIWKAAINVSKRDKVSVPLKSGVYVQLTGPNYETPAEVRMCRTLGGDAVGMSTAIEAIAANQAGFNVAGISCITNLGCGISDKPLSCEEVITAGEKSAPIFKKLVLETIHLFNQEDNAEN